MPGFTNEILPMIVHHTALLRRALEIDWSLDVGLVAHSMQNC